MSEISRINSLDYWDNRFSTDWEACEGSMQSRFFTRIVIENLPQWLIVQLRRESLVVADWGCAQGDGTDVWASYLDPRQLIGVDFSAVAIGQATIRYPAIRFLNENWLEGDSDAGGRVDVLFSSNTLEHFTSPYNVLEMLSVNATKAVILALPYREMERITEHFYSFLPDNIPLQLSNGFRLVWSRVVDCSRMPSTHWPGEQIILVFADPSWFGTLNLTLSDCEIRQDDDKHVICCLNQTLADRDVQIVNLNQTLADRDVQIVSLNQTLADRYGQIAGLASEISELTSMCEALRNSRSWRITRPLRFVCRLCRHGLLDQDRLFLFHAIRNWYHRLPLPLVFKKSVSFSYHQVLKKFQRKISSSLDGSVPFAAPSIQPSPQGGTWDYIVWGVIDWHFRHQRPQQLTLAIAEVERRVFYISPNLIDDGRAGFAVESIDPDGRIFQVNLFAGGAPSIYSSAPSPETVVQLRQSLGEVLDWANSKQVVSLVDHPFWYDIARVIPNSRLAYDCMDHHEGFGNNGDALLRLEQQLVAEADVTITTSSWLENAVAPHARKVEILRNACDFVHFSKVPTAVHRDPHGRPVIGYYGAIAEWFDLDLVEAVAKSHPGCCVMLIGADTVNAKSRLGKLSNVTFTGEVSYSLLPQYLYGFDVCLLPFKIIPLTLATNPVKAYEYLSAGKPVVAVDLPEMSQFEGLIRVAANHDEFVRAVREAMETPETDEIAHRRRAFARSQTWGHRAELLREYSEDVSNDPRVSVVVVTYNNLELTKACLASIDAHSQYENLEVIVVDNASSDGTQGYLAEWVSGAPDRKIITNGQNRGFAAANNQGLVSATGDYLVLLNNDTYVTPGWIRTLVRHLERDKTIGLIGPVTNNIGNEAKIDISYGSMDEMLVESAKYTRKHIGKVYPLRTAAFFCAMMSRAVYEIVGGLEESFGLGFFEDDDYCRRIEQVGLRIVCAEDVFIHHHLSASFDKLKRADRQALFKQNKSIYEAKWGTWTPHAFRKVTTG